MIWLLLAVGVVGGLALYTLERNIEKSFDERDRLERESR